jgi:nitrite reductase (NADH) small subunit
MEAIMDMQRLGSLAELKKGKPLDIALGARKIAIFDVGGDVIAVNGKCPHAGGPLHCGEVANRSLTCPWHGWSYDLASGKCAEDPALTLEIYPVRIDGDDIMVAV